MLNQGFEDIIPEAEAAGNGVSRVGVYVGSFEGLDNFSRNFENVSGGEAMQRLPIEELGREVFFLPHVSDSRGFTWCGLPHSNAAT